MTLQFFYFSISPYRESWTLVISDSTTQEIVFSIGIRIADIIKNKENLLEIFSSPFLCSSSSLYLSSSSCSSSSSSSSSVREIVPRLSIGFLDMIVTNLFLRWDYTNIGKNRTYKNFIDINWMVTEQLHTIWNQNYFQIVISVLHNLTYNKESTKAQKVWHNDSQKVSNATP